MFEVGRRERHPAILRACCRIQSAVRYSFAYQDKNGLTRGSAAENAVRFSFFDGTGVKLGLSFSLKAPPESCCLTGDAGRFFILHSQCLLASAFEFEPATKHQHLLGESEVRRIPFGKESGIGKPKYRLSTA
jgi:hypothetical protein